MKKVVLYWNHICILHNYEKTFLEQVKQQLLAHDIALEVTYFGLGYPEHMSEYLAKPDAVLPDIILSADLEVFEDNRIFSKLLPDLYPCSNWVDLKDSPALNKVNRNIHLLPFLAIPLVYYTTDPQSCEKKKITEIESLSFGGVNNSAGKSVTKAVWNRYGKEAAAHVVKNSMVCDMPIGAFKQVQIGQVKTALVPSIYALRADGSKTFMKQPIEGTMLIPSYFCARKSIEKDIAMQVIQQICCEQLCDFYAAKGDLIVFPNKQVPQSKHEDTHYFIADSQWFEENTPQEFYKLYGQCLPLAHIPM